MEFFRYVGGWTWQKKKKKHFKFETDRKLFPFIDHSFAVVDSIELLDAFCLTI